MRLNSHLFNSLWGLNGKKCTIMSYVYIILGFILFIADGDTSSALFCGVLAELSKVDKELRFLSVEQAQEIIEVNDKADDDDEQT